VETTSYSVKTEVFQGPLDLLLNLIEKRKLFISDISLAKVTDDYIEYVKSIQNFPIAESAHFILIASTLLLIKSKSLLPTLDLTLEEESSIEDLEKRLKLYKRIKDLSIHVKNTFGKEIMFEKMPSKNIEPVFSPEKTITSSGVLASIKEVLKNVPKVEKLANVVVKKVLSLEETIVRLTERVKSSLKMSFKNFSGIGKEEKVNVIVSFLAMLELVKQGVIAVTQDKMFDDIDMQTQDLHVPNYM